LFLFFFAAWYRYRSPNTQGNSTVAALPERLPLEGCNTAKQLLDPCRWEDVVLNSLISPDLELELTAKETQAKQAANAVP
jgi:hypothetical protein